MCDTQDGWVKDDDTYYFNKSGGSMGWSKEVDGKYLGSDGKMVIEEG